MPLVSQLFRGDIALEACLVKDSAHLLEGTRGPHVKKIQKALALLDGALIDGSDAAGGLYGRSTADAVLAYKRARGIINRSYQNTADNIVGKMTIASLDGEMSRTENRPPLRGCPTDFGGSGPSFDITASRLAIGDTRPLEFPPGRLNVTFQFALFENENIGGSDIRIPLMVSRASQLLAPFGLQVSTRFLKSFPYSLTIGEKDEIDVKGIRKAAANADPGTLGALRVIVCHLRNTTSTATSQGERTGVPGFKNFVLLNKDRTHPDNGTLLHEMIHCSDDQLMNDFHDSDRNSIFSRGENRTALRDEHAVFLNKSFSKS